MAFARYWFNKIYSFSWEVPLTKLGLGILETIEGVGGKFIKPFVVKVIEDLFVGLGFFPVPMVTKFGFGTSQITVSFLNNVIHWSKVRNEVILFEALVTWWAIGKKWFSLLLFNGLGLDKPVILGEVPLALIGFLLLKVVEGSSDVNIHTKLWDEIVFLVSIISLGPS